MNGINKKLLAICAAVIVVFLVIIIAAEGPAKINKAEKLLAEENYAAAFEILSELDSGAEVDELENRAEKQFTESIEVQLKNKEFNEAYKAFVNISSSASDDFIEKIRELINNAIEKEVRANLSGKEFVKADENLNYISGNSELNKKLLKEIHKSVDAEYYALVTSGKKEEADKLIGHFPDIVVMTDISATFVSELCNPCDEIYSSHFDVVATYSDGSTKKLESEEFEISEKNKYYDENKIQNIVIVENAHGLSTSVAVKCPAIEFLSPKTSKQFAQEFYNSMRQLGVTGYSMELDYDNNGQVKQASFWKPSGGFRKYVYFLKFYHDFKQYPDKITDVIIENNSDFSQNEMNKLISLTISKTLPKGSMTTEQVHKTIGYDGELKVGKVDYEAYRGVPPFGIGALTGQINCELRVHFRQDRVTAAD